MVTQVDQKRTFLMRAEKAIGTEMFQNLFAVVDGEEQDLTDNGNISCAVFVSGLLLMAEKIPTMKATVGSLEALLQAAGWEVADSPEPGDIVFWEETEQVSGPHRHVGIAVSHTEAISHLDTNRTPGRHHITFNDTRPIERIYRLVEW